MKIYYIRYEAIPTPDFEDYDEVGGAYINCWIKAKTEDEAKEIARKSLNKQQWKLIALEECFPVEATYYEDEPESMECFEEALTDGESYIFYEWPNEPQEEDTIH